MLVKVQLFYRWTRRCGLIVMDQAYIVKILNNITAGKEIGGIRVSQLLWLDPDFILIANCFKAPVPDAFQFFRQNN